MIHGGYIGGYTIASAANTELSKPIVTTIKQSTHAIGTPNEF